MRHSEAGSFGYACGRIGPLGAPPVEATTSAGSMRAQAVPRAVAVAQSGATATSAAARARAVNVFMAAC
jgi:hypothetical protein